MAIYNKFNSWVEYLCGDADLFGTAPGTANMLIAYLSNAAPSATADLVKADLAEITTGSGYAGPVNLDNVGTRALGVLTVTAKSFTVTAAGGSIATFQYVAVADDTLASDPLVCWFDYGSPVPLASGETFSVLFNSAAVGANGTLFTVQ
ncbi:MAG: hypothetical protein EHM24_24070 [Acidobacteria bacterium]|nr:MAG: hypothetical protein EHM24_24070 [Acidobacteriota bacterium]